MTTACMWQVGSTKFGAQPGRTCKAWRWKRRAPSAADHPPAIGCVFVGNFVGGIADRPGTARRLSPPISAKVWPSRSRRPALNSARCARSRSHRAARRMLFLWSASSGSPAPRDALTTAMTAAIDQGTEGGAGSLSRLLGMVMARHILYGTTREKVAAVTVRTALGAAIRWRNSGAMARRGHGSPLICDPIRRSIAARRPTAPRPSCCRACARQIRLTLGAIALPCW